MQSPPLSPRPSERVGVPPADRSARHADGTPALPGPVSLSTACSLGAGIVLLLGIFFGSRGLRDFDSALVWYAGASVFSGMGIAYRYSMWLQRPPTRLYWRRGWQFFLNPARLARNSGRLAGLFWDNFVLQRFIERRSPLRWGAHWLISWGCLLAAAVTFPLSFGWLRFETAPDSQETYYCYLSGIRVLAFPTDSLVALVLFHVLDIAAVMVLAGILLSLVRRARDRGALSVQQFANDLFPLVLLFAVSITGLMLTVSSHVLHGTHHGFLSQFHAITVIMTLMYLPFGKFFHVFQRPAQLGVRFYKDAGAAGEPARCIRCGEEFGTRLHVEDLKLVQAQLGIRYEMPDGTHYQDVCPPCRRKNLALIQDGMWRAASPASEERTHG